MIDADPSPPYSRFATIITHFLLKATANMQRSRSDLLAIAVAVFGLTMTPVAAWAYVDPAAGGLLFQIAAPIVTIVVAGLVYLRDRICRMASRAYLWFLSKRKADVGRAE